MVIQSGRACEKANVGVQWCTVSRQRVGKTGVSELRMEEMSSQGNLAE